MGPEDEIDGGGGAHHVAACVARLVHAVGYLPGASLHVQVEQVAEEVLRQHPDGVGEHAVRGAPVRAPRTRRPPTRPADSLGTLLAPLATTAVNHYDRSTKIT